MDKDKVEKVVGRVYRNGLSKFLHQLANPRKAREKLEGNEEVKENLHLLTQAYRLELSKDKAMTNLGAQPNSGVSMVSGGKVVFDSATGQVDMAGLRKANPFFASYIEASGDIWRGIVPGVDTSGGEFYDVMAAPVAFYFTRDTMAELLASNYGKFIANGSKLTEAKEPVDGVVGGLLAPGGSVICVSAKNAKFLSEKSRIKVINPAISSTKMAVEQAIDLASAGVQNETVKSVKETGGALATLTDSAREAKGEDNQVKTKEQIYALTFSVADGQPIRCDVQMKWDSAQGIGNQASGRTGTLYAIPAINIGQHASDILDVMNGALKDGDAPAVDLAAVREYSEKPPQEEYRKAIHAWAASTYRDGRFPASLPTLDDLDTDLSTMINTCLNAAKGISECKTYITSEIRAHRQHYYRNRKGSEDLSREAVERIRKFVDDDFGDDVIIDYFDSQTMSADDMQVEVLKAVAAWAKSTFGGKDFSASVPGLGELPGSLPAKAKEIDLRLLASREIDVVLQEVKRSPRSSVKATADQCEKNILGLRGSARLERWRSELSFGNFSMQCAGETVTSSRSAADGFENFLTGKFNVPDDKVAAKYVRACVTLNTRLQEASRWLAGKGIWRDKKLEELQKQARTAIQLILEDWIRKFLAVEGSSIRDSVSETTSGADLLKFLSNENYVRGGANDFWKWVTRKL